MKPFILNEPLPKYGATLILRKRLIEYILRENLSVGSPFLTDRDVVHATGRSRTSVRKVLDRLQKEGWIERRCGVGTFVGEKVLTYVKTVNPFLTDKTNAPFGLTNQNWITETHKSESEILRLGVVIGKLDHVSGSNQTSMSYHPNEQGIDWLSSGVLQGLDHAAYQDNLLIELMGLYSSQPTIFTERMIRSSPDLLVCIGPPLLNAVVIGEARRQGIPAVLAMVRSPELAISSFFENNAQASQDAVDYLYEAGHRRIGFVQILSPSGWWSIDRYEGYRRALKSHEIVPSESLILWVPQTLPSDGAEIMRRYLKNQKPTALICGCARAAAYLQDLTNSGELSIPNDLSVVVYDQLPAIRNYLGGVKPTSLELPVFEVGERIGSMSHQIVQEKGGVRHEIILPCRLVQGDSVAPPGAN
ncbi:MAG: substrate-binding domain-containing protein [Planctomycetia bacterium]|nr:substrate-binding domain-containing protein [Planctomycetia bacterium]